VREETFGGPVAPGEGSPAGGGLDRGLAVLVRLSAEIARGADADFDPVFGDAVSEADVVEVEEALLQSYLFLGYPAALNAIAAWRRYTGKAPPVEVDDDPEAWAARGEAVCRRVYGSAYPSLRDNIAGLRPEMDLWMVQEGYGKVLGRPGLELWRRECCIVAVLAVLGAGPQLRSHLRGALRTGASVTVVEGVLTAVMPAVPERRRGTVEEVWHRVRTRWEQR
jgi:4-carboxymuconolactone decarboxylase